MYEEKDYILRLIHEIIRTIAKLIFHVDWDKEENEDIPLELKQHYKKLTAMIDEGKINDAENLLTDCLDAGDLHRFRLALAFYDYLNKKDASFLEENNFSRKEVADGLKYSVNLYGYGSMLEAFTEDLQ